MRAGRRDAGVPAARRVNGSADLSALWRGDVSAIATVGDAELPAATYTRDELVEALAR